jgi:hypothetical protein
MPCNSNLSLLDGSQGLSVIPITRIPNHRSKAIFPQDYATKRSKNRFLYGSYHRVKRATHSQIPALE